MKTFGFIALTIGQAVWYGWVFQVLWGWFIVPTFAAPFLSIPQALGIVLVVRSGVYVFATPDKDPDAALKALVLGYVYPLVTLGLGWIYTWFL